MNGISVEIFVGLYLAIGFIYTIGLIALLFRVPGGGAKEYLKECCIDARGKAALCAGLSIMVVLWPLGIVGIINVLISSAISYVFLRNVLKD